MKWISKSKVSLLVIAIGMLSTGCKKDAAADAVVSGPDSPATPGKVDNSGGFNIKVNPDSEANYYIHLRDDFTKKCTVLPTATTHAEKNIECVIEVEELEGMFWGIDMVLNVPSSMCKFVVFTPYVYWGALPGTGRTTVTVNFDNNGTFIGGSAGGGGSGTVSFSAQGTPQCSFDYSPDAPNCCSGTYSLTTNSNVGSSDPDRPPSTVVTTGVSWGGLQSNCLTGSGKELVSLDPKTGYPVPQIYSATSGQSKSFKVGEKAVEFADASIWYANYVTGANPTAAYMQHYEWVCYDDASEDKARIRVQIREWNESSEFDLLSSGDSDTVGTDPDWGTLINDYEDWDDIKAGANGYPGFYK